MSLETEFHLGSCVAPEYELRVTERCLGADLALPQDANFADISQVPIVHAFRTKRSLDPRGSETIGPVAGDRTVYKLRNGNDHRGATIYDVSTGVVWLCAYGFHRSREANDAYDRFMALIASGEMFPSVADYKRLGLERKRRFDDLARLHAEQLVRDALARPGLPAQVRLGRLLPARLVARLDGDVIELLVAFPADEITPERRIHLVLAVLGGDTAPAWELVDQIGGVPLSREVGFRLYRAQ